MRRLSANRPPVNRRARALLPCLALLLSAACATAPAEREPPPPLPDPTRIETPAERRPIDIRRVTIIVRDMEASLRLYRDALGLAVNYDAVMNVSSPAFAQDGPPRPIRLVLLNGNDPWIGWIGLIQYTDRQEPPPTDPPRHLGAGSHVIVASVQDAQAACDRAAAAPGVRMVTPPKLAIYPPRTPGAPPIRVLGCQFWDPDGAYLELNQTLTD